MSVPLRSAPSASFVSSGRVVQAPHVPDAAFRARNWAVPSSSSFVSFHVTDTALNGFVDFCGTTFRSAFVSRLNVCTAAARYAAAGTASVPGSAIAYDTTPAPPTTTAPIVIHALRLRLSGLYACDLRAPAASSRECRGLNCPTP
jgi:hypothetical protein